MEILTQLSERIEKELGSLLSEWGHSYRPLNDSSNMEPRISAPDWCGVFLIEWGDDQFDYKGFLSELKNQSTVLPYFVLLIGKESSYQEMCQALEYGAHDFLLDPLDKVLLEHKLGIAKQIVTDKRAHLDSTAVLERYAEHIDKIAAERARQLFHAERLSTLGTMSAGLAHEIKTPLGYISASLETAQIYWDKTDPYLRGALEILTEEEQILSKAITRIPKALERINIGLEKIHRITTSLQSFARASQGEKQEIDIHECIEMALEIAEGTIKQSADISMSFGEDLPPMHLDHLQLEQVIINLVVNACHALEGQTEAQISISTGCSPEKVWITIDDNGPGIPEDKWESIWQPYYTTKEEGKGTGLGLSISKGLIRDNRGILKLTKSKLGGACFEISFER